MKTGEVIALGAVGFLLLTFLAKAKALGNLNFLSTSVRSFFFQGVTPSLDMVTTVQNTSSTDVTINSFTGNVYLNGSSGQTYVGNVSSFQPITIQANRQQDIPFTVSLSAISAVNSIIQAIESKNFTQHLTFDGSANVGGTQVRFTLGFDVGLGA